ncbi:MAG TPA: hypothetical protein PLV70_00755 [Flavobacteriales bacterium]|nr:hypothetical protein [Flavobacteriales bacterium]HRO40060.1 hypothetical protein [Flavobacteriales bacterium]HRQ83623.1 hypothetical protein [Flavobacteriales bacterium]
MIKALIFLRTLPVYWFYLIAVLSKLFIAYYTIDQAYVSEVPESFALCSGDCQSYIRPIENLLDYGVYAPDYRMPGYGMIYLPLYALFSQPVALNLLVLVQIIVDILATMLLMRTVWMITESRFGLVVCMVLYGIGCTVSVYDKFVLTESISASLVVASIYFLVKFKLSNMPWLLALSSLFMTWAYFCRPVVFPLFILLSGYVIYILYRRNRLMHLIAFALPFLIIQSLWSARNYYRHGQLYLLTQTKYYPFYSQSQMASFSFSAAVSDMKHNYVLPVQPWMNMDRPYGPVEPSMVPQGAYTPSFTVDSLQELQRYGKELVLGSISEQRKHVLDSLIAVKLNRYTASIKEEHIALVYLQAPAKRLRAHVFKSSGVQFLHLKAFHALTGIEKLLKLGYVAIFLAALYGTLFFIVGSVFWMRRPFNLFISLCCLYAMLVHPILLGMSDPRYLYGFYPLFALAASLFYSFTMRKISKQTSTTNGGLNEHGSGGFVEAMDASGSSLHVPSHPTLSEGS